VDTNQSAFLAERRRILAVAGAFGAAGLGTILATPRDASAQTTGDFINVRDFGATGVTA